MAPMMSHRSPIEYVGLFHNHGIPYSSWSTSTCATEFVRQNFPELPDSVPVVILLNEVNDLVVGYDFFVLAIYHTSELDFLRMSLTAGVVFVNPFLDGCSETLPNVCRRH
jgi:hypothetical protein